MSSTSNMSEFINFNIQYNRIVPPTIYIIGAIGNILSLITFSSRALRKNPCATYFFYLAIAHLNNLTFGLLPNYLIDAHGIDLITVSLVTCRLRFFIVHCSLVLSSWFIVLAGIDRFCISSRNVNRRNFSNLKNARISVGLSVLICFILYAHVLGLFIIEQTKTGPICYAQSGPYRVFYDFFLFATYSFTPPILMIIVGLATFYNTHQTHRQINPVEGRVPTVAPIHIIRLRKRDRQFIKMLLIQLILSVILTLPIAVQKLYATFTQNISKSADRLLIENFFAQFVRTLTHVNSAIGFYLYTLSGSAFRREFYVFISQIIGFIFGVNNQYHRRFQEITGITTNGFESIGERRTTMEQTGVTRRQTKPMTTELH